MLPRGLPADYRPSAMISKVAMSMFSMGLAFCLGLAFTPLGCGGTQETGYRSTVRAPDGPTAPEATVTQLTDCTKQGASRLTDTHYAILFDVNVTEGGDVGMVKIKDSMIGDREIEACMVRALEGMSLPSSITAMRSSQPVSRGMGAESRALMGNAGVLGAAVSLLPILIVVAGVTILIAVTIHSEDREKERCKKVLEMCVEKCTEETIPSGSLNGAPFFKCRRQCLEAENCWGIKLY